MFDSNRLSLLRYRLPALVWVCLSVVITFGFDTPSLTGQTEEAPTGSFEGSVTPPHDHDFVLATARILDLNVSTRVGADGRFRFDGLRPGSYLLEVEVPSLGVAVERITIRAGETTSADILVTPGAHFDEIVVTASIDARNPLELATATSSLSGEELSLRLQPTLGETLAQEPGISSTFFGPGASRPIIRGMAGDRVRVLEGGLDTGDASGVSADHAVTTDPAQAERIEVLRGPATLLYGSSAIGGAINVIDGRIPTLRSNQGISGSLELRGGSVNDERTGVLELTGGSGDWAWTVGAIARETDDYEIPGFALAEEDEDHDQEEGEENPLGIVPNSDLETQSGRLGVTYFGTKGFFGVAVSGFDSNYGLPGGHGHGHDEEDDDHHEGDESSLGLKEDDDHGHEEEEEDVRIDMQQRRLDLRGEWVEAFGPFQALRARLGATDYEHVELEGTQIGTRFFNDFVETRIEAIQTERTLGAGATRHTGAVGLQYLDREFEAIGDEAFLPKSTTERLALFTLQEFDTGDLAWQLGARFETQDIDPIGAAARSHDGFSTSLGLVWRATETLSVAASLARSVKLPAPEELFSDGVHVATQTFELGDPNLQEETGLGLDLSLRYEGEHSSGELTLFRQDFDDFIYQAFTGGDEDGFPVVLYSQTDAEFTGAEFKARLELYETHGHHLHLQLSGDYVEAKLARNGGYLPRIPPMSLAAGVHYHSERWNGSAEVRWVDQQDKVAVSESPTDGYTLFNASLGYRFLFSDQIVDLMLRGRNLSDEEARPHTSFLKNLAPLPGRDVSLSIKLLF